MKCISHISHTADAPVVYRTTEALAADFIATGEWHFCPKHKWKQHGRLYLSPTGGITTTVPKVRRSYSA